MTSYAACIHLSPASPCYPEGVRRALGDRAPASITARGNLDILQRRVVAFFCSVKCPGNLILQVYDLARTLREVGVTVAGGFHSPLERECLTLLLRGTEPVIMCLARDIAEMRVPSAWRVPLEQGRLLLLSPFRGHFLTHSAALPGMSEHQLGRTDEIRTARLRGGQGDNQGGRVG
jgi:hypothetical protein